MLGPPSCSASLGMRGLETALGLDEADDALEPLALLQVGHDERPLAAHPFRVGVHLLQGSADMRGEVDLVDHQKIGAGDAGTALGGELVAGRDVDPVYRE